MNQKLTFAHPPFCPSFPSFPVQKLTETKTSVKKLEFLSFSPIWADANKYMCVTSTEVFLLLFLGNYKWTEKGGILVRSFTHHLYSNQLVKHSSLILSLFYDSVEKCAHELWNEGVVGKLHARAKHKNSHFHSNSDLTTI